MNYEKKEDLIRSTLYWDVRLNPNQKYLGRCAVVLKRPCASLSEVTQEEMSDFLQVIKNLEALVKKTFGATMFNWACSMNHAYQVNRPNPQVHWHMIPRYIRTVEFRGKTFRDEHFGYRSISEMDMVSDDLFGAIMDILKKKGEWRFLQADHETTDAERENFDVPTLAQLKKQARTIQ